jgi:hypothetical protein
LPPRHYPRCMPAAYESMQRQSTSNLAISFVAGGSSFPSHTLLVASSQLMPELSPPHHYDQASMNRRARVYSCIPVVIFPLSSSNSSPTSPPSGHPFVQTSANSLSTNTASHHPKFNVHLSQCLPQFFSLASRSFMRPPLSKTFPSVLLVLL